MPGPWLSVLAGWDSGCLPPRRRQSQAVDSVAAPRTGSAAAPHQDSVSAPDPSPPAPEQDGTPPSASSRSAEPPPLPRFLRTRVRAGCAKSARWTAAKPRWMAAGCRQSASALGLSRNTMRATSIFTGRPAPESKSETGHSPTLLAQAHETWLPRSRTVRTRHLPKKSAAAAVATGCPARQPLRRERKRLGLSHRELWQALKVHWRTVTTVEGSNRAIPAGCCRRSGGSGWRSPGPRRGAARRCQTRRR